MLRMKGHTQLVLRRSLIVSEVPQVTSPSSWSTLSESPFPHFITLFITLPILRDSRLFKLVNLLLFISNYFGIGLKWPTFTKSQNAIVKSFWEQRNLNFQVYVVTAAFRLAACPHWLAGSFHFTWDFDHLLHLRLHLRATASKPDQVILYNQTHTTYSQLKRPVPV